MTHFAPLDQARLSPAFELLKKAVAQRAFPGGVLAVGREDCLAILTAGRLSYAPDAQPVSNETIYDLASLTKVVATTAATMILDDRNLLDINIPVARYLPEFLPPFDTALGPLWKVREEVTVRHLLAHTSGLPAYEKFFLRAREKSHLLDEAVALPLEEPPGQRTLYSDVGFILLGEVLERVAGERLDTFCEREIFRPLGMGSTGFNPSPELRDRIAPTEQDDAFRKRLVHGEVQDENAWVMGGVAGHAGLFATAGDLASFAQMMLREGNVDGKRLIQSGTIQEFTRAWPAKQGPARGLGWDKPGDPSSSGRLFSPASFGHLGYTGTSLWVDPQKQLFAILLTNRIHPTRPNESIKVVRPAIHDAVVQSLFPAG